MKIRIYDCIFAVCALGLIAGLAYGEYSSIFAAMALILNERCYNLEEMLP